MKLENGFLDFDVCGPGHRSIVRSPQPSGCSQQYGRPSAKALPPGHECCEPVFLVQGQRLSTLRVVRSAVCEAARPLSIQGAEARLLSLPKHKFKNKLYSLDASTIDLCLSEFPWARCRAMLRRAQQPPGTPSGFMSGWSTRAYCRRSWSLPMAKPMTSAQHARYRYPGAVSWSWTGVATMMPGIAH